MDKVIGRLTVFLRTRSGSVYSSGSKTAGYSRQKVTFGAEPKEPELLIYLLRHYYRLQFSPAVETAVKPAHRNPKRAQRKPDGRPRKVGIGTKSQQALQLQQEQNKQVRKRRSRARKQTDAKRLYALKQQQKRESTKDISPLCFSSLRGTRASAASRC